jgi:hypothetical protein
MRSLLIKLLSIIILLLTLSSCQKIYNVSKSQDVLFQFEYIDSVGLFSHWGIFVDVNGNILTYNQPEKWNFPGNDQILTQKDLLENVAQCKGTTKKIPAEELQKYINCIDNMAASKVSLQKKARTGFGTSSYYCYQFSENSSTYKRTIIKSKGEFRCENLNFYSKKVVAWMNEIRKVISI